MSYALAILALGLAVAVHELGHFAVARLFGLGVPQLTIGIGPKLWAFVRRGTEYAIAAIPLGASVQVWGLNVHEGDLPPEGWASYGALPPWKRVLLLGAGLLSNGLFAWMVLCGLYLSGTHVPVARTVGAVAPASEAARAQLRPGDEIVAVDGALVESWSGFADAVADHVGRPVTLTVRRENHSLDVRVWAQPDEHGAGRIGVAQQYVYRRHPFGEAAGQALAHLGSLVQEGAHVLARLARGRPGGQLATHLAVVRQVSQAASSSADAFLRVVAALSLALAAFHLLPVPGLDGGRLLFAGIEATGRRVSTGAQILIHSLGIVFLAAALGWLVVADLVRLYRSQPVPASLSAPAATPSRPDAGTL